MEASALQHSPSTATSSAWARDDRARVELLPTSPPYKWICFLTVESVTGKKFVASGFKIHLPELGHTAVVTSGHCTFVDGAYAARITVQFPGQMAVEVGPNDLYASPEYINSSSVSHDYGLILLPGPGDCEDGFGWSAILNDEELDSRLVMNCGFPADKPQGSMWVTGGKITSYTSRVLYMHHLTSGGLNGSPVYTWHDGFWTVLGVRSCASCPYTIPRFTIEMISRFLERTDGLKPKTLRSVAFPDVYVRCDGRAVTQWLGPGSGIVNCRYKPAMGFERFYIYPVEINPSRADECAYKVVIESAKWKNVYIRLGSKGMKHFDSEGGGEVNCQFNPGAWEVFVLQKESNGGYSFRSDHFTQCYIRLDGREVHSEKKGGNGTVNCQYYNTGIPPKEWETFYIEL